MHRNKVSSTENARHFLVPKILDFCACERASLAVKLQSIIIKIKIILI